MNYENITIDTKENIAIVTINREKAMNALNRHVFNELDHYFSAVRDNKTVAGIIITGAGNKAFAAGADIKEFGGLDASTASNLSKRGQDIFFKIENLNKPVIAAVNGFSLGGGNELAMACHMRVASENARFGQPEVNLGIITGYGGSQRLVQYIGKGKAMELLLTGDMIKADEALRLGLLNHVVPAGQEVAKSMEILQKISTKGPFAVAKMISTVNDYFDKEKNGYQTEVDGFGSCAATEDFVEGAKAFVEKRAAKFKGV